MEKKIQDSKSRDSKNQDSMPETVGEEQESPLLSVKRYYSPKIDLAFKKLFAQEGKNPLLMSLLNSFLHREGEEEIKEVELLPTELVPNIAEAKLSIVDVRCRDKRNFEYIVEVHNRDTRGFIQRAQQYASKRFSSQLVKNDDYLQLKPVIFLAIVSRPIFPPQVPIISYHHTIESHTKQSYLEHVSYAFVELSKFKKKENALKTPEDHWLYLFKKATQTDHMPEGAPQEVQSAYDILEKYRWSSAEEEMYFKYCMGLMDDKNDLLAANERGKAEGKEEGKEEEKRRMAKSLLQDGVGLTSVAKASGLTEEELQSLLIAQTA